MFSKKALQTVLLRLWFSLKKNVDLETFKLFISYMFYMCSSEEGPHVHPEILLF